MLSTNLKKLRSHKNITQRMLADSLGVTQQAVAKWENGKAEPDTETLKKLAKYFGISVDRLLGFVFIFGTEAAHQYGDPLDELPKEARESVEEFKQYIIEKYKKE